MKSQSKNIDFSQATFVRPFRTGTSLPGTCSTGEMFFKTDASAGANTYGCVSSNSWSVQGTSPAASIPLEATRMSNTVLRIGGGCTPTAPCLVRLGTVVYGYTSPADVSVSAGIGRAYLFVDTGGMLAVGVPSTLSATCSGCQVVTPLAQFPPDTVPLATWNASSGVWDSEGIDSRSILSTGPTFSAGPNVSIAETGSNVQISAVNWVTINQPAGSQPPCSTSVRGTFWHTQGGPGVKDSVQVCAKDAADSYAWRTIY